jgi:hypothetical protein
MDREQLLKFLRSHNLAVQSSVSKENEPQAAVVGFAVSENFEFVFDTVDSTRKVGNLRGNPRIALTIGGLADGDGRQVVRPQPAKIRRLILLGCHAASVIAEALAHLDLFHCDLNSSLRIHFFDEVRVNESVNHQCGEALAAKSTLFVIFVTYSHWL